MQKGIYKSEKKLRVAAYCRVSTAKGEQESSYKTQVAYFKEVIAYHPTWEMVEIYADYGITGTSLEKRKDFSRMLEDCVISIQKAVAIQADYFKRERMGI